MYQKLIKLFKSSSVYTVGNVLNRALFLISMPVLTRYMEPTQYGTLSVIHAVIGIMVTCYGLGTTSFAMRYYYEYDTEREQKRLLGTIFSYIIGLTFFVSLLLSLFGDFFFERLFKDIRFSPYMFLGIWICFVSMFEILPEILFRIRNDAALFITVRLAKSVLLIALSIVSVVILKRGAEGPLAASLIVAIISGFYYLFYLKDKMELNFSFPVMKQCLKFSLPVLSLLLGRSLLDATDRLILQRFVDLSVVAFYSVGTTIGSVLVMIASSIDAAWLPFFYATAKEQDERTAKLLFSYASIYLATFILFLGLCAVIFRHEIIYILAPSSFYPVIEIVPYIMIAAALNALFFIPVRGILQEKKPQYLPIIILTALSVNICLNFVLIPRFEMLGAALATIASSLVMLSICFIVSQRLYLIPYQYIRIIKVLVVCIISFLLSLIVHGYSLIVSIALKSFVVMLFPGLLFLVGFFEEREISKITELTRKSLSRLSYLFESK